MTEIRMNLIELLEQFNVPFKRHGEHHHTTANFIQVDCPFCSPNSGSFRYGFSLLYGGGNCWECGKHSAVETLTKITGLPLHEIRKIYNRPKGLLAPGRPEHPVKCQIPAQVCDLQRAHRDYLRGRGFTNIGALERLWRIRGIGISTRLQWRLFIPIELYGETVSWTTRAIVDDVPARYISASPSEEVVSHKSILYGHDYIRHAAIVCEGPIDVWRIGPGAVATFGTGFSFAQINMIIKYPVRIICFDSEPEAQRRAKQMCAILATRQGTTTNVVLDSADPGSAGEKEIKRLRKMIE